MLKKIILTTLQGYICILRGVYCKPCLQPISCLALSMGRFHGNMKLLREGLDRDPKTG